MEFIRDVYTALQSWRAKASRKPLLLMGARQIGKTTVLKSFGKKEYSGFLYVNLEREQDLHEFFKGNKDPQKILDNLSLVHGKGIKSRETLIVLDEIQECKDALIALKYFEEELPDIHIIGAGSLLGLSIGNDRSFPVGKVEFLDMYPLSFSEYLLQADEKLYKSYRHFLDLESITIIPDTFFNPLQEKFKEYVLFGGMPEVASSYLTNRNMEEAQTIQDQILRAYELDFVKHADKTTTTKIQRTWNSIPSQLAKENKKFLYKVIRTGARARAYEEAIEWLVQAGLVYKISRITKPSTPLKAYEDVTTFKLYTFEAGLLIRLAGLAPKSFLHRDKFFKEFKGSIAENYVAQSLKQSQGKAPYYWTSDGKAEIDYVIERSGNHIPIEVKSGRSTKAKSLTVYKAKYDPALRVRISNMNLDLTDELLNIPLFYTDEIGGIIDGALGQ